MFVTSCPRHVLRTLQQSKGGFYEDTLIAQVEQMTLTALETAISNAQNLEYPDTLFQQLILVKPGLKRNIPSISIPTNHIFDLLVKHMPDLQDAGKSHLINLLLSNMHTMSAVLPPYGSEPDQPV